MKHRYLMATAAAIVGLAMSTPAFAAPMIDITVVNNVGDAPGLLNDFTAGKKGFVTEDFEGFTPKNNEDPLNTKVGRFTGSGQGNQSGACVDPCDSIQVINSNDTPFNGRVNTTNGAADGQWLDSNDLTNVVWDIDVTDENSVSDADFAFDKFTSLAFFMTDVSDQGGRLTVMFENGGTESAVIQGQGNGTINFVTANFAMGATSAMVEFQNTSNGDGYGIDDATIAVPIPATLGLLGTGLLGLGLVARRNRNA